MAWILIIGLVLLSGWLGLRYRSLLLGVRQLSARLGKDEQQGLSGSDSLQHLARVALGRVHHAERDQQLDAARQTLLETLLNQIEDALFLVGTDREILLSNEAARKLYPTEKGHEGRPLIEVTRDHRLAEVVDTALEAGKMVEIDFERQHRWYRLNSGPLEEDTALAGGVWILLRDVTEQQQLEDTRRDFVANASHELRTPLAIIRGYLEMFEDDPVIEQDPTRKRAVNMMVKHGERITRMVDDMLAISRLESGTEPLSPDWFDMGNCIRDAVEHLTPLIQKSRAKVDLMFSPEALPILGDRFYWDQMLINLIENAIKQNPNRDLQIRITSRLEHRSDSVDEIIVEIEDNGIGIPTADLPHIFKRFYRVAKGHEQTEVKGTGLGLSIVNRAIEAHSGSVEVESEPGVRTCFRLRAPVTLQEMEIPARED